MFPLSCARARTRTRSGQTGPLAQLKYWPLVEKKIKIFFLVFFGAAKILNKNFPDCKELG